MAGTFVSTIILSLQPAQRVVVYLLALIRASVFNVTPIIALSSHQQQDKLCKP